MAPLTLVALAALPAMVGALPEVVVDDPTRCVDASAVAPALAEALPPELAELPAGIFNVMVTVVPAAGVAEDVPESVIVRAAWSTGEPLLDRTVPIVITDCPTVPKLIAVIVARRLSDLPQHEWEQRRPPPPPPPPPPVAWRFGAGLGGDLGLDSVSWAGRVELIASFGQPDGVRGVVGLAASAAAPVPVGVGEAQLTAAVATLGASWDIPLGPVRLVPSAHVMGGVQVATGLSFDETRTDVLPALRVAAELALHSDLGLYGAVGAAVPVIRTRVSESGTAATRLEPLVRLQLTFGFAWSGLF